jgi:nucleoside-diphosphate-sugar epimerase
MLMRVLITGGSGFIGTNIVEELAERKDNVANLDIRPPRLLAHAGFWKEVSLLDRDATRRLVEEFQPDYVIHAAARADLRGHSLSDYALNTVGTSNLIDSLKYADSVKRTLIISTMLVCRNGYSPHSETEYCANTLYGASKVQMEEMVRKRMGSGLLDFVIVRPTSIWGPWFAEPYRQFFEAIVRGVYFHPGIAPVKKQFGYVGNVVDQILTLMTAQQSEISERVFYVGDYSAYVVRDWADLIQRELGASGIRTMPLSVLRPVAAVGDLLVRLGWNRAPLTSFRLSNMLLDNSLPFDNTARVCGPLRCSVAEGVRKTVAWLREQTA